MAGSFVNRAVGGFTLSIERRSMDRFDLSQLPRSQQDRDRVMLQSLFSRLRLVMTESLNRQDAQMDDLIWVGNTLYPRGMVILAATLVFLTPFVIAGIIKLVRVLR